MQSVHVYAYAFETVRSNKYIISMLYGTVHSYELCLTKPLFY